VVCNSFFAFASFIGGDDPSRIDNRYRTTHLAKIDQPLFGVWSWWSFLSTNHYSSQPSLETMTLTTVHHTFPGSREKRRPDLHMMYGTALTASNYNRHLSPRTLSPGNLIPELRRRVGATPLHGTVTAE
jgi:hypothetical protein